MSSGLHLDQIPAEMTASAFWGLFGRVEHAGLDFKRGVSEDGMLGAIPAMAMTTGGLIIHGVKDDRTIVGCPPSQNTLDRIHRFANECTVEVEVKVVRVDGIELTITAVPEVRGRIVTTPDGRLLRRVGGDSQPLRGDAFGRFVREREERAAEEEALGGFDPEEFDLELVNQALEADGRDRIDRSGLLQGLTDLGVALPAGPSAGMRVLTAAAILFAADPTAHVAGASVQIVCRSGVGPGPGPASARVEYAGPLSTVAEQSLRFIADHTQRFEAVVGRTREGFPEYPEAVLREAVVNALAHRDYGLIGATVDITVWDDRVEIASPGPLPGHITVDNMRAEHYSRNRRLMGVLKTVGLVEEYGEGVDRMFREMESRLLEPPLFNATPSSVTVTLHNRRLIDVEDQVWLQLLTDLPMTVAERQALVHAHREGSVTPRRLRVVMPDTDADALLAGATARGLLTKIGSRGGSRYVLSEEVVLRAGSTGIGARSRQQQMLLDEIDRRGSISSVEGVQLLGVGIPVVRGLLRDLMQAGLVRAEGRTRARRYYAAD